jgi:hypothetical protein
MPVRGSRPSIARNESIAVHTRKSPIDRQPFQSRAERERDQSLEKKYRDVAIPEVAAVLKQPKEQKADKVA